MVKLRLSLTVGATLLYLGDWENCNHFDRPITLIIRVVVLMAEAISEIVGDFIS